MTFFPLLCGLLACLVPVLDIPVFWPILVLYFFYISFHMYRKQKEHMLRYGYTLSDFYKRKAPANDNK